LLRSVVVPRFEPFPGLRYSPSHIARLDDVVCPPYDVISDTERMALEARSPVNVVRLELPQPGGSLDRYGEAARLLDAWRDGGFLKRDHHPAFYGYRMTYSDTSGATRSTVGVIGALGLEVPGVGILPHEETTPKAKSDRLDLLEATHANISPIWGLSPASGLSASCRPPAHPVEHAVDAEGVRHELWPINDPEQIDEIARLVGSAPVLIADGHHRYETALAARDRRGANGALGDSGLVMALVVELAEDELMVQAIHRLVSGLPAGFDVAEGLREHFDLARTDPVDPTIEDRMRSSGSLAVVSPVGTWLARPRPSTVAAAPFDLDSSRFELAFSAWPDSAVLTYQHGSDLCAAAVGSGQAQVAILLRPATVEQIAAIGRGGVRMPAKTTFFWPKPRTGMVLRELVG
jgi:uncharacterized protein (DUF1015 family)